MYFFLVNKNIQLKQKQEIKHYYKRDFVEGPPITSKGGVSRTWRFEFQARPNLANRFAIKFSSLGTWWICHCPSEFINLCTRLRTMMPRSLVLSVVKALITFKLYVRSIARLKPFFSMTMIPSRMSHNSTSKREQVPKWWLKPIIRLPSMPCTTPPTAAFLVALSTTPSVERMIHLSSKWFLRYGYGPFIFEKFWLVSTCHAQLNEALIISLDGQEMFWKMKRFLLFLIRQAMSPKRLAHVTPCSCNRTRQQRLVDNQVWRGLERTCFVDLFER